MVSLFPAWFISSLHSLSALPVLAPLVWHHIKHFNDAYVPKTAVLKTAINGSKQVRKHAPVWGFWAQITSWEFDVTGSEFMGRVEVIHINTVFSHIFIMFACHLFPNVNFAIITNVFSFYICKNGNVSTENEMFMY